MWVGGDAAFLVAMLLAVWVWLRAEEREGRRVDAKLDRERERELARAAAGGSGGAPGPGVAAGIPPGPVGATREASPAVPDPAD